MGILCFVYARKINEHMDWFQFVVIMSNAVMNTHIPVFVWTYIFISLGWISRSGIARLYGKFIFDNLRYQQTVFQNDCTVFTFPQYMMVPVSPLPHQHLVLPLDYSHSSGCFIVGFIYFTNVTYLDLFFVSIRIPTPCYIYGLRGSLYLQSVLGLPWWSRSEESACQYRRHWFHSWSGRISYALEKWGLCHNY